MKANTLYIRIFSLLSILLLSAQFVAAAEILSVGSEETAGPVNGVRPSIDTDSKNQPHIVIDTGDPAGLGGEIYIFHKIGGKWSGKLFANRTSESVGATPSSITQPWIEIDSKDRAWIFAWYFLSDVMPGCGQGLWLYDNIDTNPTKRWFRKKQYGIGWTPGNVQIDPHFPDQSVVMTRDGAYGVVDTSGETIATGEMGPDYSGEKFRFRITPREGQSGVWHGIMNGFSRKDSGYHNSLINKDVTWASYYPYRSQGHDHNHAGVCGDLENPEIGYMAAVFDEAGLCINIWNGSKMIFSPSRLKVLDSNARFRHRVPPAMTSAFGGGFWIAWGDHNGYIEIAHITPDGSVQSQRTVTSGRFPAINTDRNGNVHMAYVEDGLTKYRKIEVSGAIQTAGKDYDGDGLADLAVYDQSTGKWYCHSSDGSRTIAGVEWNGGSAAALPISGDYDGDGMADITAYNSEDGTWFVQSSSGQSDRNGAQWGWESANLIPLNGDFDGDRKDDLAVYNLESGKWYCHSSSGRRMILGAQWGWRSESVLPVPADYDGDGMADLAVYDSDSGKWFCHSSSGKRAVMGAQWGWNSPDLLPVPADYDGDGRADLAVYDRSTGKWFCHSIQQTRLIVGGKIPSAPVGKNVIPVPADYDGDGQVDLAVYDLAEGKWYSHSSGENRAFSGTQWGWNSPTVIPPNSPCAVLFKHLNYLRR